MFLHAVEAGPANRSYGVQAARLAGVPKPVLARAKQVLAQLENGAGPHGPLTLPTDMPLFWRPRNMPPRTPNRIPCWRNSPRSTPTA